MNKSEGINTFKKGDKFKIKDHSDLLAAGASEKLADRRASQVLTFTGEFSLGGSGMYALETGTWFAWRFIQGRAHSGVELFNEVVGAQNA